MKVLCVGANYSHHRAEMGHPAAAPAEPIWFWKPTSAIIGDGDAIELPPGIGSVHHEVELALRIGRRARRLANAGEGRTCIDAFTVAVDVTARDLQAEAKTAGRPWAQAKGFDTFLPLGAWVPADGVDLQGLDLRLAIDGEVCQEGPTSDMTWPCGELVRLASQWTTLEPGDVLLTGTPAGVGPIEAGQELRSEVVGQVVLRNGVRAAQVG